MLIPKKVKHRKHQKGRVHNMRQATQKIDVSFGNFGLKATTPGWVTSRQIEAARRVITRSLKRGGKLWIRIFPDKPITFHGSENTMGSGKGAVDHYVAVVKAGMVMFELDGVADKMAMDALAAAAYKLPVKTRVVKRT
jgi:large subunit ribosomal protein L16